MFRPAKNKEKTEKTSSSDMEFKQEVAPLPQVALPPAIRRYGTGIQVTTPSITDHGALSGLGDNDHPQYELAGISLLLDGSRRMLGDIMLPVDKQYQWGDALGYVAAYIKYNAALTRLESSHPFWQDEVHAQSFVRVLNDDGQITFGALYDINLVRYVDPVYFGIMLRTSSPFHCGALELDDELRLGKVPSLPSADASTRGLAIRVEGGTGEKDILYLCKKKADDTYAWLKLLDELDVPTLTLDNLEDVEITSPADGEVLTYESATSLWKNKAPTGAGLTLFGYIISSSWVANATRYFALNSSTSKSSESDAAIPIVQGTFKKLWISVPSNARTTSTTFTLRVNSQNTALTLTVNAGQTGVFSVEADVAVSENDLVNLKVVTGAGSELIDWSPAIVFQPS